MTGIRWCLVILLITGFIKDMVGSYVKIPLPQLIQDNAVFIFLFCVILAFIIQLREVFIWSSRNENQPKATIGWRSFFRLFLITVIGIAISVIFTTAAAIFHGWFLDRSISLSFIILTFFSILGIWYALPLGSSVKLPYSGLSK